jgi:hypothetical protein
MEVVWREFHRFHRLPLSSTGFHILPVDSATLTYSIPNTSSGNCWHQDVSLASFDWGLLSNGNVDRYRGS